MARKIIPKPERDMDFTTNWNGKLNCEYWTTIRASHKYKEGEMFNVCVNGVSTQYAKVVKSETIHSPDDLSEVDCFLDTGKSKKRTIAMLRRIYGPTIFKKDRPLFKILFKTIHRKLQTRTI